MRKTCRSVTPAAMLAALLVSGCGSARETSSVAGPDTSAAVQRARAAAAALAGDLARTLFASLDTEGPVAAMRVCSEVAQGMTASHSREGLTIRRVSDRSRNPANAPDATEAAVIVRWRARQAAGGIPSDSIWIEHDAAGGDRLALMRPLMLGERCVVCHGAPERIPEGVRAVLARRYPNDRATGFAPGELRGAVSVRVALDQDG